MDIFWNNTLLLTRCVSSPLHQLWCSYFLSFCATLEVCHMATPLIWPLNSGLNKAQFTSISHFVIKVLLWSKNSLLFFLQILKASLFDTSLAKSWASNFIQRLFSLSASLGFHGPPLFTIKTDRLDFRGLDRG